MKEIIFTLLGSIITIVVTWVFNMITTKRQHKMEMQRLAVQKIEVSKTAIGWLMEAKSELFIVIWALEHNSKYVEWSSRKSGKINKIRSRSKKQF